MPKAIHTLHRLAGTVCQTTLRRFLRDLKKAAKAVMNRYKVIRVYIVEATDDSDEGCFQRIKADGLMMEFEVRPGAKKLTTDQACEVFYASDFLDYQGLGIIKKTGKTLSVVENEFVLYVPTMQELLGEEKMNQYCDAFFGLTSDELSRKYD